MPQNKKDSFTFSDKIKNSKPAFNPFSKRVSSRIGNNGKPKKTLFERTKRDAPFFVAAAAALLMLPFLYKYSGNINQEPVVPPSSDSVFDPERYGFEPSVEDPSGQIAQLAGRDPLSLIKGWGTESEEPNYDLDRRDGLDDNYTPVPAPQTAPYRAAAPAATRGAFQRQATKVKELGSASMNLRGGGGAGFGRFGGANLKNAARQNSAGAPRAGVKPVSLQPLRAAGTPSRSYFGQGGAAQARASREAMGKSNAAEAIRDAMFTPLGPGRIGGLGGGEFAAGSGGNLTHTYDYKGITPWWWDLMKQRSQMEWELWFNLKKKMLEGLADMGLKLMDGLFSCILTGTDDWSMGSMFGASADSSTEATCCGIKQKRWVGFAGPDIPFEKEACKGFAKSHKDICSEAWKEPRTITKAMGPLAARVDCLSNGLGWGSKNKGPAELKDRFACQALDTTHNFELQTSGKANKWHVYHAVIAKNYVPFDNGGTHYLCGETDRNFNRQSVSAGNNIEVRTAPANAKYSVSKGKNTNEFASGNTKISGRADNLVRNDLNDSCVIYVAEGKVFDWKNFKSKTIAWLNDLGLTQDGKSVDGEKAFNALHLYSIEGYAFKNKMSKGANVTRATNQKDKKVKVRGMPVDELPVAYAEFETVYVINKGNSSKDKEKFKDKARSFADTYAGVDGSSRTQLAGQGKENAIRTACPFSNFQIKAMAIDSLDDIRAALNFDPKVHGQAAGNIIVTVDFPEAGIKGAKTTGAAESEDKSTRTYAAALTPEQKKALAAAAKKGPVTAHWVAKFGDKLSTDDEAYVGSIEPAVVQVEETGETTPVVITRVTPEQEGEEEKAKAKVGFFGKVSAIPTSNYLLDENLRKQGDNNTANAEWDTCEALDGEIGKKKLLHVDDDVKRVLAAAKQKYDAKNAATSELVYDADNVSIANLLDALMIVEQDIPLNAVCMLGKSVGANSRDGRNGNNMFGTFAAYMGPDSSFYPALYKSVNGQTSVDYRFYGCQSGKEVHNNKAYHYGHYNWNWHKAGDQARYGQNDRQPYEQELEKGPWKGAPLNALANAVGFKKADIWNNSMKRVATNDTLDSFNRVMYHKAYKDVFQTAGSCNLRGTMRAAEVKAYIKALCTHGADNQKPQNGSSLACNRRYVEDKTAVEQMLK